MVLFFLISWRLRKKSVKSLILQAHGRQPPILAVSLFLKILVRCPTVLQADVSLPLDVRSKVEVERDVDLINGKQQPFYFEKENLPYEMIQQVLRENDRETLGKFFTGPDARYRGRIRQWCGRWRRSLPWRCSQGTSCTSPAGRRRNRSGPAPCAQHRH